MITLSPAVRAARLMPSTRLIADPGALSRLEISESPLAHRNSDQPQRREPNGRGHPPDLSITPLTNRQLQPAVGHRGTNSNRRLPRPNRWRRDGLTPCLTGRSVLELHTRSQLRTSRFRHLALNLDPVGFPVTMARIGNPLLQPPIVREHQKALRIVVEAASRPKPGCVQPICQRGATLACHRVMIRELAEHLERLVEQQNLAHARAKRALVINSRSGFWPKAEVHNVGNGYDPEGVLQKLQRFRTDTTYR